MVRGHRRLQIDVGEAIACGADGCLGISQRLGHPRSIHGPHIVRGECVQLLLHLTLGGWHGHRPKSPKPWGSGGEGGACGEAEKSASIDHVNSRQSSTKELYCGFSEVAESTAASPCFSIR